MKRALLSIGTILATFSPASRADDGIELILAFSSVGAGEFFDLAALPVTGEAPQTKTFRTGTGHFTFSCQKTPPDPIARCEFRLQLRDGDNPSSRVMKLFGDEAREFDAILAIAPQAEGDVLRKKFLASDTTMEAQCEIGPNEQKCWIIRYR